MLILSQIYQNGGEDSCKTQLESWASFSIYYSLVQNLKLTFLLVYLKKVNSPSEVKQYCQFSLFSEYLELILNCFENHDSFSKLSSLHTKPLSSYKSWRSIMKKSKRKSMQEKWLKNPKIKDAYCFENEESLDLESQEKVKNSRAWLYNKWNCW